MDVPDAGRIIRAPTRRRRNEEQQLCDRIKLKKVLGLTVCSNAALDVSPISGLLAYPAGCTIVLFNAKRQTQVFLVNTSRKAFTSVAFSRCGRYVATGECGINPAIKVWELETQNGNLEHTTGGNVIAEFVDHKYAVTCVAFSPTSKYLVSVGSQHDMIVNVFDWRSNLKMASNKISSKVSAISFAEDGSYFVTVGNRHVKYWYLEGGRKYKDPIPLMGRSAILGDLRDNDFCAVACGKGDCSDSTYAITRQGHLVEFSSRRLLDKWVQCRITSANCICVNGQYIFVGCAESIIRIFNAATLEYVTTLPRTHYLGVDVAQGIHINHIMTAPAGAKYPDCIAMVFDEQRSKVSCVYNDHSLYIWDMRDLRRVGKSHSFLYHSTCIWGVETVPYNMEREPSHTLPEDSFVTCSSDDTIRVWGLEGCANNDIYRKNIYSKDLLKVVYIDNELSFIKDQETVGNDKNSNANSAGYDGRNGVRCIKISHELNHLASGDRSGNIRIYNLANLKLMTTIEAHESEVLCLEYSNDKIERKLLASASRDRLIHVFDVEQDYLLLQTLDDHSSSITSIKYVGQGLNFQMVSCGADKSIMFRTFQGNIFLRGTNTSGKTTLYDMEVDSNSKHILTACQDRNIRVYGTQNAKHTKTFKGSHSDEGSLIKLSLDPSGIYIATSCTDKTLAVYDYYSNECMARMYGHSELVTGLKFTNDCKHLISASGDGCIFIWQVPHDMIVTMQARLSQQRLRSGHAPLPRSLSIGTLPEFIKVETPTSPESDDFLNATKHAVSPSLFADEMPVTPGYRFSDVGQLPQWAKRKQENKQEIGGIDIPRNTASAVTTAINAASSIPNLSSSPSQLGVGGPGVPRARGRWAQRGQIDDTLTDLRSNSESPLGAISTTGNGGLGNTQTSDYNSASSKDIMYNQTYLSEDSSIDSGMETRREMKFIGSSNVGTTGSVTVIGSTVTTVSSAVTTNNGASVNRLMPDKKKTGFRFDAQNNDHDGDVEDISDGERTSSDHGMFYNNISPGTPTEFKVTAMNEEELRKSVRRQKFEKCGLTLTGNGSHTASTGTGTSDTEDEGSTPSAENAERSLASTLGGSSENIQQASSSFMQAALPDGPGTLLERGTPGRRSISAKHNTENGKVSAAPTITKSYTSTKKEELLKVINEAKQKLENVGYRSMRGSHSISDLSLAGNLDGSRSATAASRYAKTANPNQPPQYYSPYVPLPPPGSTYAGGPISSYALHHYQQQAQHFFNSAAPRSVLQQNYQAMRQVQQQYPPYPRHVGVYQIYQPQPPTPPTPTSPYYQQQPQQQRQYSSQTLPSENTNKSKPINLSLEQERTQTARNPPPTTGTRKSYGILKNYKSCPVSPVREEVEWENLPSESKQPTSHNEPKRHSVYSDDAKTILDMIHSDTEKMIDEITRKYGDLDADALPGTAQMVTSQSMPTHLSTTLSTAKSSCESLEENSLEYGADPNAPKRCVSEFYIYQDYYGNFTPQRKVSLSDILDDTPEKAAQRRRFDEAQFLEAQRHSSASFFLAAPFGERKSQESLISEDFLDGGESYCNSMESILSDESDCKSAPLDAATLLEKQQIARRHAGVRNFILQGQMDMPVCHQVTAVPLMVTKSYGSSPNACSSFDYYMQHQQLAAAATSSPYESFDVSSYGLSNLTATVAPAKLKSTAPKLPNSETYPRLSEYTASEKSRSPRGGVREEIPTLSFKNKQYSSGVNKSMSKDFAQQRHCRNSNPLQVDKSTYEDMLFSKKAVKPKPPIPAKPQKLVSTLTSTVETKETMKKSCSFDIDTSDIRCNSRTASVVRKFERNLQKFEREKQAEQHAKRNVMRSSVSSGTLTTQSCLKKHSKFDTTNAASRRATSVRTRQRPKISVRFNTVSQIKYTPSDKRLSSDCSSTSTSTTTTCPLNDVNSNEEPVLSPPPVAQLDSSLVVGSISSCDYEEKTFEMYIAGNGNEEHENMNMDSLKLYTKPELQALVDEMKIERERDTTKHQKNLANEERTLAADSSTSNQCKNIAKKIDIIQKLIEMEERKFEQIRQATESRMRPFECNSKKRGYVKSLTMNFDMLAKGIEKDIENEQRRLRADDNEDDLCAYARHIKRNVSLPDVLESTHMEASVFVKVTKGTELISDTANDGVEYAKEAVADSDVDDAEEVTPTDEHESEKIRNDFDEKDAKGNPKSLLPMPIEESSIRRACSLSDLHMGNMGKMGGGGSKLNGNQKPNVTYRNSSASRSANKRNSIQLKGSSLGLSSQSTSMGVLNQGSDSETENTNRGRSASTSQNRTNGPTAAARQYGNKISNVNNTRRKTLPTTFSNVAPPQDDSSSEETQGGSSSHSSKPIVPPRPRNLAFDHKIKVAGNPNGAKTRSGFEATDFVLEGNDPKAQVHNVINKLYSTTQTVMQLHANLKNCEDSLMLKELENAVIMTQNMLTNITQTKSDRTNQQHAAAYSSTEQANLENGDYLIMVNNCADLLSNFRSKHKPDDCENNS